MSTPRILFLFAHLHKGGMQSAVSNISRALPDDYEQYVGYYGTENPPFTYKARLHDFAVPGAPDNGPIGKTVNFLRRLSALRSFVAYNGIDIVVSFGEAANVINLASGHRSRKIISLRVAPDEARKDLGGYGRIYRRLVRGLYPRADAVVAVSGDLARQALDSMPKLRQLRTIPNLYHGETIRRLAAEPLPPEAALLNERRFILNVGSLSHQKGQDELIQAFSLAHAQCPDVCLVIVGRGEWKNRLEEQALSLGLRGHVFILDFDPNPYRYMARASVFALTSRYEGFPNVLVEAMICGCPVVAFDCPTGPREILGNGEFGALVEERSLSGLVREMTEMLNDPAKNECAREKSAERSAEYWAEHVIVKWQRVFDFVLS